MGSGLEDIRIPDDGDAPQQRGRGLSAPPPGTGARDGVSPLARNRPSFPELLAEGLEPHSAKEVYLWSTNEINYKVDITEVIDLKLEALSKHVSQMAGMESRLDQIRSFWRDQDGRYMENFRRIPIPF